MAVTTTNLIQGPGTLYHGWYGTATEPADSAVNTTPATSAGWTDVGGTQEGVNLAVNREWSELEVDQVVEVVGRRLTKREAVISTTLAEGTLDNLARADNNSTMSVTGSGSVHTYDSKVNLNAFVPDYGHIIVDGFAPTGTRRRVIGRRTLNTANTEAGFKKDGMWLVPVSFSTHYVSNVISSYHVIDVDPS